MMNIRKTLAIFTMVGALTLPNLALAGSQQNSKAVFETEKIIQFSKQVENYAAAKGARAFIIGRVGRPQEDLPKGIKFTHTAIAIYSEIHFADGSSGFGYAIHNLYQKSDDNGTSFLMTDYPVDFFWGAQQLKAGIIIPVPEVQLQLIELITSGKHKSLHNPKYSVVANPFNSEYQNCTEYTLDVVNASIYRTTDIERLKQNSQEYFTPQTVRMSRFKLAMGGMFMDGVTTRDHKGKVKTATFTSIAKYLEKYGLASESTVLLHGDELKVTELL